MALFVLAMAVFAYRAVIKNESNNGPASAHMSVSLPGEIKKIPSSWGEVLARVFEPLAPDPALPPVVCLPGINAKLIDEWVPTAEALRKKGYHVIIINFQSNPNTAPALLFGGFSDENIQEFLREAVMRGYLRGQYKDMIICGKSWGGKQAIQFAVSSPKLVRKLCLVAPATTDKTMITALGKPLHSPSEGWTVPAQNYIPVLLAWAKDDRALWFNNIKFWTEESCLQPNQLKLVTAETGGHRVLPEFVDPIVSFVMQA